MKVTVETKRGENEEVEFPDLRSASHQEFTNEDVQQHITRAINQNGITDFNTSIFEHVISSKKDIKKLNFFQHMYHLIGNAKGILKYRFKHGNSSFHRYENYHYETLDLLNDKGLFKIKDEVFFAMNGTARLELINSVSELCKGANSPTVLEAGCGSGLNMYLLNCLDNSLEVSGFEYTNARIASSLRNLWKSNMRENLFLADVCDLNLEDNSYDVVYTNHVLEQLGQKNAENALREIWRVCKHGMVICEPSIHGANAYEKWRMRTLGYCEDLVSVVKSFPDAEILKYKEDDIRYYPNTSRHLIVKKN